jgi:hypothetical protein
MAVLGTRAMIHVDQCAMLFDRGSGVKYLRQSAGIAPEAAEPLNAAADLLEQASRPPTSLWRWGGGGDPRAARELANPQLRRQFAQAIRSVRDREAAAVEQMRNALELLSPVPPQAQIKTPAPADLTRGARWQVEGMPLGIAMRACLNVLGDDLGNEIKDGWRNDHTYPLSLAFSGVLFGHCTHLRTSDHQSDSTYVRPPAAVAQNAWRRALEAVRRTGDVLVRPDGQGASAGFGQQALKARITNAIARTGRPVIVEDMPEPGAMSLITGYDQGGNVLIGWTTGWGGPSILFDPAKQTRFSDWHSSATAAVFIGPKVDRNQYGASRRMLRQAVEILTGQEANGYLAGEAAYEAWAAALDDGAAPADLAAAAQKYDRWIDPNIWDLAERRHYARVALDLLAPSWPEAAAAEAKLASAEFVAIHDLMWEINRTGGAQNPGSKLPKIADPVIRKQIGVLIRRASDHDAKAAGHLKRALSVLDQAHAAVQGP